jgi:hypothetical protein|tara:strand:+ start:325 stop:684 length:360 start_codon:yes stop_codon:yes gene_type:complete
MKLLEKAKYKLGLTNETKWKIDDVVEGVFSVENKESTKHGYFEGQIGEMGTDYYITFKNSDEEIRVQSEELYNKFAWRDSVRIKYRVTTKRTNDYVPPNFNNKQTKVRKSYDILIAEKT